MEPWKLYAALAMAATLLLEVSAAPMPPSAPFSPWVPKVHNYEFVLVVTNVTKLCKTQQVVTVNGMLPGPTIRVTDGDSLLVNVTNKSPYHVTIHWHGIFQYRNGWVDGPEGVTQCPIRPGSSYVYNFTINGQAGTLWWHGHSSWLRATVYGALIIDPKPGAVYPYKNPKHQETLLFGEWWNANPFDVIEKAVTTGAPIQPSDALTINAQPGDLFSCSKNSTVTLRVKKGETVKLRLVNSAMDTLMFIKIAKHKMKVVGADAQYLKPFKAKYIILGPGQTTDVLVKTNRSCGRYYIAGRAFISNINVPADNTTTTAILEYSCATSSSEPVLPELPAYNNTKAVTSFAGKQRSLNSKEYPSTVPKSPDYDFLYTVNLNFGLNSSGGRIQLTSLNNYSLVLPTSTSILQAHYYGISGVYTTDFPDRPQMPFNYTDPSYPTSRWFTSRATKVRQIKYNSTVQIVMQGTSLLGGETHPMHLHGYDFYVIGRGTGNFNPTSDPAKFNLVDPAKRNTVNLIVNGWIAFRFVAKNPGAWLLHCHLDFHMTLGMATVLIVEDGPTPETKVISPPSDLPKC